MAVVLRPGILSQAKSDLSVSQQTIQSVERVLRIDFDSHSSAIAEICEAVEKGRVVPGSAVQQAAFHVEAKIDGELVVFNCVDTGTAGKYGGKPLVLVKSAMTPSKSREIIANM